MELRYYQREAIEALYDYFGKNPDRNPCIVLPTGSGKTILIVQICRDVQKWQGRVLVLAHVKELLEQAANKLRSVDGLDVGIYSAAMKQRDTESDVLVAGIQSVYQRGFELAGTRPFNVVIVDECFAEGTMISTPSGDIPIEKISPEMKVYTAIGVGRVLTTSIKPASETIKVVFSDGSSIECTENHPVFTEFGFIQAGSLEIGQSVFGIEGMRMLWKNYNSAKEDVERGATDRGRMPIHQAKILLNFLREDGRKLHERHGNQREGIKSLASNKPCSERSWRKWKEGNASALDSFQAGGGLDSRASSGNGNEAVTRVPNLPEDRHCESSIDDCHRDRGKQSRRTKEARTRLEEESIPGSKRVVSVSRVQESCGKPVFNMSVQGHPSYWANGTLVHNCHRISTEGDGMYRELLNDLKKTNPKLRIIGLTATPYRTGDGYICSDDHFINDICYQVGIKELIAGGFLCQLSSKRSHNEVDMSGVKIRKGDFVQGEMEAKFIGDETVIPAVNEILSYTVKRNKVLIFCCGIAHASEVAFHLEQAGQKVRIVTSQHGERDKSIEAFRDGDCKYLVNVSVLTEGFDATKIDCVVLLRATVSPGLYYQCVGRALRIDDSKSDALVLDFGGNIQRLGTIDNLKIKAKKVGGSDGEAPVKACPDCQEMVHAGLRVCSACGYQFPDNGPNHESTAASESVLTEINTDEYEVDTVSYFVHTKRNAKDSDPKTMRVSYFNDGGMSHICDEWVCVEHTGFAFEKAYSWWHLRSNVLMPSTAEEAVKLAKQGALSVPSAVKVRSKSGEKFVTVIGYTLGPKPDFNPLDRLPGDDDEVITTDSLYADFLGGLPF